MDARNATGTSFAVLWITVEIFSLFLAASNSESGSIKFPVRERERVYLLEKKHTWHNKTVKILRAGCQKGHSPSCWLPMIYNVLYLTHIEGDITESPKT